MMKKTLLVCMTLIGSLSVVYAYAEKMNAASSSDIARLKQGDKVILGTDGNGDEVIWDVHVENASNYTLSTKIDRVSYCTASTNNRSNSSDTRLKVTYCDFVSLIPGKDDSPVYTSAKSFDDAFYMSNQGNTFEKSEIINQSATSAGGLKHAIIPLPSELTSGGSLGITAREQLLR